MIGFKANDCKKKNRRKVDFYNHVAATTPCAMKTGLHVEGFGAKVKSLCMRTASAAVVEVAAAFLMHRTIPQSPWVRACIPSYSVGSL